MRPMESMKILRKYNDEAEGSVSHPERLNVSRMCDGKEWRRKKMEQHLNTKKININFWLYLIFRFLPKAFGKSDFKQIIYTH